MQNTPFIVIYHLCEIIIKEVIHMDRPSMSIITRGIMMPHYNDRGWSRKVVELADAREHGIDAYNAYLQNHHAMSGSAALVTRV